MKEFSYQNFFSHIHSIKTIIRDEIDGTFQSESLDNPGIFYLKMKMNECYGRVEAGDL